MWLFRNCLQFGGWAVVLTILAFVEETLGSRSFWGRSVKKQPVCHTEACQKRATYLLNLMDQTVNPCEDFYQFTCGKYLRTVEIPEGKDNVNIMNWMDEYSKSQMVGVLLSPPQPSEFQCHGLVKTFYKLCMDVAAMDRRGVSPLLEKLEAAGGWPVLGNWSSDNWNILDTEITLKNFGFRGNSLFSLEVENKWYDPSAPAEISIGVPMRDSVDVQGSADVQNRYEYMVDVAVLLGAERATAEEDMAELMAFQMKLFDFSWNYTEVIYNTKNLSQEIDWIDWNKLLKNTVGKHVNITEDDIITVSNVGYIKRLEDFLKEYSNRVIANYMLWGAVEQMADKLTSQLRALKPDSRPRWEQCYTLVQKRLSLALSSLFVFHFTDIKVKVDKMAEKLRQEFLREIMDLEWLDDETRLKIQEKLVRMGKDIAYSKELVDKEYMDGLYEELEMNKTHFFEAVMDLSKWETISNYNALRDEETMEANWNLPGEMTMMVNAFNNPMQNYIGIPAGIIHNPFYDPEVPDYANYGGLGMVIGHEILHSFDNNGINFDPEGEERMWLRNETLELFNEKKQCIIDRYSNFTDFQTNMTLNGDSTQGENIADNGGFKLAYRAYKRLVGNKLEPSLPGLQHYTNDQILMVSFAAPWCSKITAEELMSDLLNDPHSPGHFRVLGVAMNSPEFSKMFHCKEGDRMNPPDKCVLW